MRRHFLSLLLAVAAIALSSSAHAVSYGRWHVPGTIAHFFGYGFGPGHHAPIVRYHGCHFQRSPRVACAPGYCFPYGHGYCSPAYPHRMPNCAMNPATPNAMAAMPRGMPQNQAIHRPPANYSR